MTKKIMSLVICVAMILSCFCTSVGAVGINTHSDVSIVEYKADTTFSALNNADIISIEFNNLDEVGEYARIWVDGGKTLFITSPEISAEELAIELNIPKDTTNYYNSELLFAYAIYKIGDCYVFEAHYSVCTDSGEEQNCDTYSLNSDDGTFDSAITLKEYNDYIDSTRHIDDLIDWNAVTSAHQYADESNNSKNTRDVEWNQDQDGDGFPDLPTKTFSNVLYIQEENESSHCGYARGTVRAYEIGRGYINGEEGCLYTLVYSMKVYPNSTHEVVKYSATMACGYSGHHIIDTTTLEDSVSTTISLGFSGSLSASAGLEDVEIGGERGIEYGISWSFNGQSQTFKETSNDPYNVTWTATPFNPGDGDSFGMAPGGEVFVVPGYQGQRAAFMNMSVTLKGGFLDLDKKVSSVKMGGFF